MGFLLFIVINYKWFFKNQKTVLQFVATPSFIIFNLEVGGYLLKIF